MCALTGHISGNDTEIHATAHQYYIQIISYQINLLIVEPKSPPPRLHPCLLSFSAITTGAETPFWRRKVAFGFYLGVINYIIQHGVRVEVLTFFW
jgi:hypothetical protein